MGISSRWGAVAWASANSAGMVMAGASAAEAAPPATATAAVAPAPATVFRMKLRREMLGVRSVEPDISASLESRSSRELTFVGRAFTARQAPREGAPYINSSELQFKASGPQIFLLKPGGVEGQGCVEFLVLRSAIIRL